VKDVKEGKEKGKRMCKQTNGDFEVRRGGEREGMSKSRR